MACQQLYPSYGDYNTNIPMKTFAGQPRLATQAEVNCLQMQVNQLEKAMDSEYSSHDKKEPCNRCPKSKMECNKLQNMQDRNECLQMCAQCDMKGC